MPKPNLVPQGFTRRPCGAPCEHYAPTGKVLTVGRMALHEGTCLFMPGIVTPAYEGMACRHDLPVGRRPGVRAADRTPEALAAEAVHHAR